LATRLVCQPERLADVQSGEHAGDDIGPIELLPKARGTVELRGVKTTVKVPANEVLAAYRGLVVVLRGLEHPAPAVGVSEQRKQLHPVLQPVPA
jgi:hypothetical protein